MLEGGQPEPPAILVYTCGSTQIADEVLAGIEEEGVPAVVERRANGGDATALALSAASRSTLSVGVGIDDLGAVCVQHEKLPTTPAELSADGSAGLTTARTMGHNAARLVVGVPLRLTEPR